MKSRMEKLEHLLELGGIKKDITLLVISGIAVLLSLLGVQPFPFDMAWVAIVLCGVPIILEAVIGLVTAFDIKADVLVSIALIASLIIGEDFAAGEVAFIMQLGALLEDLTVARARAGIEKLCLFFHSLGMPITFEELGAKVRDIPDMVAHRAEKPGGFPFGGFVKIQPADMEAILRLAAGEVQ